MYPAGWNLAYHLRITTVVQDKLGVCTHAIMHRLKFYTSHFDVTMVLLGINLEPRSCQNYSYFGSLKELAETFYDNMDPPKVVTKK